MEVRHGPLQPGGRPSLWS